MRSHKNRRNGALPPFVDPSFAEVLADADRPSGHRSKHDHKARQIGRQVQRVLTLVLAGDTGDDVLRELYVDNVVAAQGASHLFVHVVIPRDVSITDAMQRLSDATPRLRSEIARAITRKRVPELTFIPIAAGEVQP